MGLGFSRIRGKEQQISEALGFDNLLGERGREMEEFRTTSRLIILDRLCRMFSGE